ncbi:MAG TPA: glycine/sarcosine/betaine reductase component B subunit [Candidatus Binatia bacterium]|nr:glycine/sarcosine/betaine reductase component B subunit [Candidatus Binatia bacterium]
MQLTVPMKLELAEFPVKRIVLGRQFSYRDEILELDEPALLDLAAEDPRLCEANLSVAAPGEHVRITGIRDIVEPRCKVAGGGSVFPGILGPIARAGEGRTHRVSGMTVVAAAAYEGTIRAGTTVQRSAILDMSGPGARISRFSALTHLVLSFRIASGLSELDAHQVIQGAELRLAARIAEVTAGVRPNTVVTYDLSATNPELPNVVLIQGCITDPQHFHSGVGYYGMSLRESLATIVHPNEIFDGAITVDTTRSGRGYYPTTWDWQNHPLVLGLCAEHERRLNFLGVVLQRIRFETAHGKDVGAHNAARLAQAIGADGALVTWIGGGNAFVDVMLTVSACEQRGIKTTLVTYENGGKQGTDSPVLFYSSEARGIVSTGSLDRPVSLPAFKRIIGPYAEIKAINAPGANLTPAREVLDLEARDLLIGGADLWGQEAWTCVEY